VTKDLFFFTSQSFLPERENPTCLAEANLLKSVELGLAAEQGQQERNSNPQDCENL